MQKSLPEISVAATQKLKHLTIVTLSESTKVSKQCVLFHGKLITMNILCYSLIVTNELISLMDLISLMK